MLAGLSWIRGSLTTLKSLQLNVSSDKYLCSTAARDRWPLTHLTVHNHQGLRRGGGEQGLRKTPVATAAASRKQREITRSCVWPSNKSKLNEREFHPGGQKVLVNKTACFHLLLLTSSFRASALTSVNVSLTQRWLNHKLCFFSMQISQNTFYLREKNPQTTANTNYWVVYCKLIFSSLLKRHFNRSV